MLLPRDHENPFELSEKNDILEKGIRVYVEEISQKNGMFGGKSDEKAILVTSITKFLRLLPAYHLYAHSVAVEKLPGLMTQARFIVEYRDRTDMTTIQAEVLLVSEDFNDYEKFILKKILPNGEELR